MAPARVPVRRAGNGQHPVPGWSGEFDWICFVPFEELPSISNPRDGLIINATNKIVPDNFAPLIAVSRPQPYRAQRTATPPGATAGTPGATDSSIIQQDIVATSARGCLGWKVGGMGQRVQDIVKQG